MALRRFAGFVAVQPPFAEAGVAGCGARPDALALRRFAGFVAVQPPFAGPDVAMRLARPDALELRRVAARPPFAGPGFAVRRALLGPDVLPVLLLPALAASFLAHRHSMAVSLQPKSELLSIAKVFS